MGCCCTQKKPHLSFFSIDNDARRKRREEVADLETSVFDSPEGKEKCSLMLTSSQYYCCYIKDVCLHNHKHVMLLNFKHDALTETTIPSYTYKVGLKCADVHTSLTDLLVISSQPWPLFLSVVGGFFLALEGQYYDLSAWNPCRVLVISSMPALSSLMKDSGPKMDKISTISGIPKHWNQVSQ